MNRHRASIPSILALLAAAGCGDQAGIPQPIPIPDHMLALSALPDTSRPVDVVGLPGAVAGGGRVYVKDTAGNQHETRSTAEGTFLVVGVPAMGGDELEVRFEDSAAARLVVPTQGIMAPMPPGPVSGVPPVEAAGAGRVRVQGLATQPGRALVVVNGESGEVAQGTAGADRRFQVEIGASPGDTLRIYEEQNGALGPPWSPVVP